jgi:sec-independent protein translocase protein TatA
MFEGAFSPLHWLIVLAIAVLIFGPKKLPEIGKSLGTAIRGFKEAVNSTSKESRELERKPEEKLSSSRPEPKG